MKTLLAVIVALALAVGAGVMTHNEPGYVFVDYGGWRVETTLAVLLGAVVLGFLLFYLLLRSLFWTTGMPSRLRQGARQRQETRARRLLNRGLIELSGGHWLKAERLLAHPDVAPVNPVLAGLLAALAAQAQQADDRRDQYLRDAVEAEPQSATAISLVQAEMQCNRGQFEQAVANLNQLLESAPRQDRVPRMLARVLEELGDWRALADLMPEIRRRGLYAEADIDRKEVAAWRGLLHDSVGGDAEALMRNWAALPKAAREHPSLLRDYSASLRGLGRDLDAEPVVQGFLERRWSDELIIEYGLLDGRDAARQLDQAERWHKRHASNPWMLLTLGRLCVKRQLWGKARGHFEASLAIRPMPETHLAYGHLLQRLGEAGAAADQYRRGLADCLHVSDDAPEPVRRDTAGKESSAAAEPASGELATGRGVVPPAGAY